MPTNPIEESQESVKSTIDSVFGFITSAVNVGLEDFYNGIEFVKLEKSIALLKTIGATFQSSLVSMDVSRQLTGMTDAALSSSKMQDVIHERHRTITASIFKETQELAAHQIEIADGISISAGLIYNDFGILSEKFVNTIKSDSGLITKGMDGMVKEGAAMMINFNQAASAYGFTASTMTEITRRELSKTGKITGDSLQDLIGSMQAAAKISGESMEKISSDVQHMLGDFSKFGMMSEDQMTSMSVYVGQIGIGVSDISSAMGKFQSFDQATAAMSSLAAATGVTLDTMELFKLANTDPEGFARSLKEQLSEQGLVYDDMNFQQKKIAASALGFSPQKLEALLNDELMAVDRIDNEIGDEAASRNVDEIIRSTSMLADNSEAINRSAEESKIAAANIAKMSVASFDAAANLGNLQRLTLLLNSEIAKNISFEQRAIATEALSNSVISPAATFVATNGASLLDADQTAYLSPASPQANSNQGDIAVPPTGVTPAVGMTQSTGVSQPGVPPVVASITAPLSPLVVAPQPQATVTVQAPVTSSTVTVASPPTRDAKIKASAAATTLSAMGLQPVNITKLTNTTQAPGSTQSVSNDAVDKAASTNKDNQQLQPIQIILQFTGNLDPLKDAIVAKIVNPPGQPVRDMRIVLEPV